MGEGEEERKRRKKRKKRKKKKKRKIKQSAFQTITPLHICPLRYLPSTHLLFSPVPSPPLKPVQF
jgi:hypothetical protein